MIIFLIQAYIDKRINMNNNIQRITKGIAEACKECISVAYNDASAKKEILRGGGLLAVF